MTRRAAAILPLLLVAVVSIAALRPGLKPWPGIGYRTSAASYLRPLQDDVSFTPILTVGDTLIPPHPEDEGFIFYPVPDGLGIQRVENGLVEIYVAHELTWDDGLGGGRVSRLLMDPEHLRLLAADWIVDGREQFDALCAASLVGPHEGFLTPRFLINEESTRGPNRGLVAAVDTRTGEVQGLPWLGRFEHERTIVLPVSSGPLVTILTEDARPGESQLYMYLAASDSEILEGRGQLYVLRVDPPSGRRDRPLASIIRKGRPLAGRFVPVKDWSVANDETHPLAVELAARTARALNFVRLEGAAPDRRYPNAFYVADTGDDEFLDPVRGGPVTGRGRIYHLELDPFDPTIVKKIEVVLDGDEGDDIFRPDYIETDEFGLMIQEDPGRRGVHPSRILRYDLRTQRLDPLAECAERDPQGRLIPEGTGGAWETTGITDASEFFGPGSWLVAVQAHTMRNTYFRGRAGGGQLLLMRTTAWGTKSKEPPAADSESTTEEERDPDDSP